LCDGDRAEQIGRSTRCPLDHLGPRCIDVALSCIKNSPVDPTQIVLATTQLSAIALVNLNVQ